MDNQLYDSLHAQIDALEAENARLRVIINKSLVLPEPWQPMETAPKDREVLVYDEGEPFRAKIEPVDGSTYA